MIGGGPMKYVAGILGIALIALGIAYGLQQRQNASLKAENSRLASSVAAYRAAAQFREETRQKAQREAERATQRAHAAQSALEELQKDLENANLPIDPRVGALLRCLQSGRSSCSGEVGDRFPPAGPRITPGNPGR